jgi:hypothetical protein
MASSDSKAKKVTISSDEKKIIKKPNPQWLKSIYDIALITDVELFDIYETIKYQGFDRDELLVKLEEKVNDPKIVIELVILCCLRGPRQAENIKLRNGKTPKQLGVPASDKKGTTDLSCSRISSSLADLGAHYMKRLNINKRVLNTQLPGWLQFPSAGSIKLPQNYRELHIQFSKDFSKVIGGEFNEQIYVQMINNAYLDENLKLFD